MPRGFREYASPASICGQEFEERAWAMGGSSGRRVPRGREMATRIGRVVALCYSGRHSASQIIATRLTFFSWYRREGPLKVPRKSGQSATKSTLFMFVFFFARTAKSMTQKNEAKADHERQVVVDTDTTTGGNTSEQMETNIIL